MLYFVILAGLALLPASTADIVSCHCDVSRPETLEARQCSLCREAEKQPAGVDVFFLKDVNPTKPNRWLALPRVHGRALADLTPAQRLDLLTKSVAKAKELFGEEWAIAYNSPHVQTQCHVHFHLGKWMPAVEESGFVFSKSLADAPLPLDGTGFWIHPVPGGLHLHAGELITETVLLR